MLTSIGSLGYGGQHLNDVLPKILTELQGLVLSGPLTGASASTAIAVADGIDTQDTIIKVLGVNQSGTTPFAAVWTAYTVAGPNGVAATGTLTLSGVVAGDTATVNGTLFTAVAYAINDPNNSEDPGPGNFFVGVSDTVTAENLAAAINGATPAEDVATGTPAPIWVVATSAAAVVTLTANQFGTAGNAITLAVGASHVTKSGATLSGGAANSGQTSIVSLFATGTITLSGAAAGDVVGVNGVNYTFSAGPFSNSNAPGPQVVPVGASDTVSAANLAKVINASQPFEDVASGSAVPATVSATSAGAVVTVTATAEGTGGNAIILTVSGSNGHATRSAATLAGGSATNAIKISVDTTGSVLFVLWFKKDRYLLQP